MMMRMENSRMIFLVLALAAFFGILATLALL
jgi:hypothetical protein